MAPKLKGKKLLERWRSFITEHKAAPVECGGVGHALAVVTRQKLAAGHLSRSAIAELKRLKGAASRASSTNGGDAHPAVASGVGAEPGAASRCDSGVEQPGYKHAVLSRPRPLRAAATAAVLSNLLHTARPKMMLSPKSVYAWELSLHPLRQILLQFCPSCSRASLAAALHRLLHLIVVRRAASRNQLPWRALAGALHILLLVAESLGQR